MTANGIMYKIKESEIEKVREKERESEREKVQERK